MEKKVKPTVYRVGDKVKILNPKWVERVGYKLRWDDFIEEARNDPKTMEAYYALMGWGSPTNPVKAPFLPNPHRIPFSLVVTAAKMKVEQQNFGGPERAIIYSKDGRWAPGATAVETVLSKRVVNTGIRITGYNTGVPGDPDSEWVPAYLEDRKSHVLLRTSYGEIEACNVELLWRKEQ